METMKCEVCGKELPITKFSKSYKHRCRECVAERTRLCRHLSKEQKAEREKRLIIEQLKSKNMNAIVKTTGEPVRVKPHGNERMMAMFYMTEDGRKIPANCLQFEKDIDWEQRKYELAKEIFIARLSLPEEHLSLTAEGDAITAIELADDFIQAYISQEKEGKNEQ